jgi:hypothetical protein
MEDIYQPQCVKRLHLKGHVAADGARVPGWRAGFRDPEAPAGVMRAEGLQVEFHRYFFGCATGFCGRKPENAI